MTFYAPDDIREVSVVSGQNVISYYSSTDRIKGAIVGGAIAGASGAVVGAIAAGSKSKTQDEISLRFRFKPQANSNKPPVLIFRIYYRVFGTNFDIPNLAKRNKLPDHTSLSSPIEIAYYWQGIIKSMIEKWEHNSSVPTFSEKFHIIS